MEKVVVKKNVEKVVTKMAERSDVNNRAPLFYVASYLLRNVKVTPKLVDRFFRRNLKPQQTSFTILFCAYK